MIPQHPELFRTCVVVRPWITIRAGFEFRVFVSRGKITCAGQYEPVYYPEVWEKRDWVREKIKELVEERVIPKVGHRLPSLVVDVVMDERETFFVCEINPFATSTSGSMFKWDTDKVAMMIGPETWRFPGPEEEKVQELPNEWKKWVLEELEEEGISATRAVVILTLVVAIGAAYYYMTSEKKQ
eukprot:TRINITY_DN5378_c0_g1_i3.p1 TRINITY_DN5378_c0_g1~~TRINITY_DN5378_c0_g1_i3.p1  ORF type:complete len:184 (-),score=43.83 TRINITY_DN5378_c0_g1_i3:106-657(-)